MRDDFIYVRVKLTADNAAKEEMISQGRLY